MFVSPQPHSAALLRGGSNTSPQHFASQAAGSGFRRSRRRRHQQGSPRPPDRRDDGRRERVVRHPCPFDHPHHRFPITYIVADNGGYRIVKDRLVYSSKTDEFTGMDLRAPVERGRQRFA
jgi:hypothetical protein